MNLSVDDEVSLAEAAVTALGVLVTWLVYRRRASEYESLPRVAPPAARDPNEPAQVHGGEG